MMLFIGIYPHRSTSHSQSSHAPLYILLCRTCLRAHPQEQLRNKLVTISFFSCRTTYYTQFLPFAISVRGFSIHFAACQACSPSTYNRIKQIICSLSHCEAVLVCRFSPFDTSHTLLAHPLTLLLLLLMLTATTRPARRMNVCSKFDAPFFFKFCHEQNRRGW